MSKNFQCINFNCINFNGLNPVTIYLLPYVQNQLILDMNYFEIKKLSDLIKKIVANHHQTYYQEIMEFIKVLKGDKDLEEATKQDATTPEEAAELAVATKITNFFYQNKINLLNDDFKNTNDKDSNKSNTKNKRLNIRLTKADKDFFNALPNAIQATFPTKEQDTGQNNNDETEKMNKHFCESYTLNEYVNNILKSYLSKPRFIREQILYKQVFDDINKAIKDNTCIKIFKKNVKDSITIRPYKLTHSNEEIYNYLLYKDKDGIKNTHLCHIDYTDNPDCDCSPTIEGTDYKYFDRMIKNGVQYRINNLNHYLVTLTKTGYDNLDKFYLEKPEVMAENKTNKQDSYELLFDCSQWQIQNYFSSFYCHGWLTKIEEITMNESCYENLTSDNYSTFFDKEIIQDIDPNEPNKPKISSKDVTDDLFNPKK